LNIDIRQEIVEFPATSDKRTLRDDVEWKVKEAYNILGCPVVLDSAAIEVEEDGKFVTVEYNVIGETEFVKKYQGCRAITRVWVAFTENGEEVDSFEGKLEGTIGPSQGNKGFGWDKIFYPIGYENSLGSMAKHKHSINVRNRPYTLLEYKIKKKKQDKHSLRVV